LSGYTKAAIAACIAIFFAIGLIVYVQTPGVCGESEMARTARSAVKAQLRLPEMAKFQEPPRLVNIGLGQTLVSGWVDLNEPRRTSERKLFWVKVSCKTGRHVDVVESEIGSQAANSDDIAVNRRVPQRSPPADASQAPADRKAHAVTAPCVHEPSRCTRGK
jgi:hypothetical protein